MQTRKPIVAGQFYPGRHDSCVDEINEYLEQSTPSESLPETLAAGIVPHAGWAFSGRLAAMVFSAIKRSEEHTSELQSHSFISYAVFCLKKKNKT